MSGHSKWHSIKHKKGAADKARGKLFAKLIKQIEVAAREGGGDVDANPTLRTMVQKARDSSVPVDTIERAIKRGTGELEGVRYEPVSYEGYAPSGVAVYVECLTDNRNRTGAEVKNIFTRNGGSLAEPGAVAWQFERKGVIILEKSARDRGRPHAGRARRRRRGHRRPGRHLADHDRRRPICTRCATALEAPAIAITSADLTMLPTQTVPLARRGDRPPRAAARSTRWRSTTTCRPSTPTSTSPTTSSRR